VVVTQGYFQSVAFATNHSSAGYKLEQESCTIAKMTARCALYK